MHKKEEFDKLSSNVDFSSLQVAAVGLHTMFETLVEAGFTQDQALRIIAYGMFQQGKTSD